MLEIIRDDNNNILASCEWWVVNGQGQFSQQGEYIWINQLEFSGNVNGNGYGLIKELTKNISSKVPWFKAAYFKREKYKNRVKLYSRKQWLRLISE